MNFKIFFEELLEMITVKLVSSISLGLVASVIIFNSQTKKSNEAPDIADNEINDQKTLIHSNTARKPSSITNSKAQKDTVIYKPEAKISSLDQSNFVSPEQSFNVSSSDNSPSYQSLFSNASNPPLLNRQETTNETLPPIMPATKKKEDEQIFWSLNTKPTKPVEVRKKETLSIDSTLSPSNESAPTENTCSANIVGGSFGNPIGITLACNFPSTIKYCLSVGTSCCDPDSGGTTYGTQVVIGPQNGNYCLSYVGDSGIAGSSVVYQQNYTINSTLPNLNVGHSKIFYQTTELIATSFISSLDFGKQNYSIGQINLKAHDPGPGDLNYSCDEIIENYASLLSPASTQVLSIFDVSLASVSSQVEIPLRLDQLDYGDNFITSYIENNSFVAPLYSCSTTKVNLDDFEYFQIDVSHSIAGDNVVREFEGEFSSYGFFEEDAVVYRSPAGANTVEKSGENLKSGIYGMFY